MVIRPLLSSLGLTNHPKLGFFHASEVITMDDKPLVALKRKKDFVDDPRDRAGLSPATRVQRSAVAIPAVSSRRAS